MSDGSDRQRGHRANVYVPGDLWGRVQEELPELNISGLLQEALRGALECHHDELVCSCCAATLSRADVATERTEALYRDVMDRLTDLVRRGGTATGAAKLVRDAGRAHQVAAADIMPLPRPSRAEAAAARERADQDRRRLSTKRTPPDLPVLRPTRERER